MAERLTRWLASGPPAPPRSFVEAAEQYLSEGCFVDWARLSLRAGDPVRELAAAYDALFKAVTRVREQQSREFARLLASWSDSGSALASPSPASAGRGTPGPSAPDSAPGAPGSSPVPVQVVPVEQVLTTVLAPLAATIPVLVIVIDGMSLAVCHELLAGDPFRQWVALDGSARLVGLSAIPSVTQASRASLLCGRLCCGPAAVEKDGFASHAALRAHCQSGYPAIVFHKASLHEGEDATLAPDVREAIASRHHKVVGVVVNAVDDYLYKSDQTEVRWGADVIKILPSLLHEARMARRLVVLLSDHGHVLDCGTESRSAEGGERWRMDDGAPQRDEIRISGSRVLMPGSGSLIAPWTEGLRYGSKRNGYHGGLTPQETLVPIKVLSSAGPRPPGWTEAPVDTPIWWDEVQPPVSPQPATAPPRKKAKIAQPGLLFDPEELAPVRCRPEWITRLLQSPAFEAQMQVVGKSILDLAPLLESLDGFGGRRSCTALGRDLRLSVGQVRELLTTAQRVLNADGYPILTHDPATDMAILDRDLLLEQFGLR